MLVSKSMLNMAGRALAALLISLALLSPGPVRPAYAVTIMVDTTDEAPGASGDCTLGEAILAAQTNTAVDDCLAGGADDVIVLQPNAVYTLTTAIDTEVGPTAFVITSTLTINGNGATLVRDPGTDSLRFFVVQEGGALTLNNLTLLNGRIEGEAGTSGGDGGEALGGAIYLIGDLTLAGVTLEGNVAQGGTGGNGTNGEPGQPGGPGGPGGEAGGGAIYAEGGTLTIAPPGAAFIDNQALGGAGGQGGAAGDVESIGVGIGGNAGAGGAATGGAARVANLVLAGGGVVFGGNVAQGGAGGLGGAGAGFGVGGVGGAGGAAQGGAAYVKNLAPAGGEVVFSDNVAQGGAGSSGGTAFSGAGGSGGAGGAAQGGGLALQNNLALPAGTLSFSGNSANGGAGGSVGVGSGIGGVAGAGGSAWGGGLFASGALASAQGGLSFVNNTAAGGAGGFSFSPGILGGAGGEAKGGGLYVFGDGTVLAGAEFRDNRLAGGNGGGTFPSTGAGGSASGGAIYAAGSLTVTGSTLISNTATSGQGSVAAGRGGAIYHEKNSFTLADSVLQFNQAVGVPDGVGIPTGAQGGALYLNDAPNRIERSALVDNAALGGVGVGITGTAQGGAAFIQSVAEFTNVTLSGNTASTHGGGLYAASVVTLTHASVVSNTVVSSTLSSGGGLTGTVALANAIVAYNAINNCASEVIDLGGNFQFPDSTCGAGVTTGDPLLGALELAAGTWFHLPASNSPVLDAAVLAYCPAADQRGVARPVGDGCDSGAIEVFWALWLPLIVR